MLEVRRKNGQLVPRPGNADALERIYKDAARRYLEPLPEGRAAQLQARLAAMAARRGDD